MRPVDRTAARTGCYHYHFQREARHAALSCLSVGCRLFDSSRFVVVVRCLGRTLF